MTMLAELMKGGETNRPDLWPFFAILAEDAYNQQSDINQFFPGDIPVIRDWVGFEGSKTFARTYEWPSLILISVRGTTDWSQLIDYVTTFKDEALSWDGGHVYSVTGDYYNQIRDKVVEFKDHLKTRKIILTGHSMGGSLAKVAASHMKSVGVENVSVITFASPFLETRTFRDKNRFPCVNLRFQFDWVAHLPFPVMGSVTKMFKVVKPSLLWFPKSYGANIMIRIVRPADPYRLRGFLQSVPQPNDDEALSGANAAYFFERLFGGFGNALGEGTKHSALKYFRCGYEGPRVGNDKTDLDMAHPVSNYITGSSLAAACSDSKPKFIYDRIVLGKTWDNIDRNGNLSNLHPHAFFHYSHYDPNRGFLNSPWLQGSAEASAFSADERNAEIETKVTRDQLDAAARAMGQSTFIVYLRSQGRI